ncbi:putative MFS family arabinose efflux permease [Humitalea rosea]|uniref:Putative MFS family arabinose efflux permease n=1 Tax=Humitalea rosea TaxID=990373 RepID=A0A2W7I503_9PROT|nr:MFS transporter [Humitalea rosea]PZW41318.1 putative MFS family arabinose efflux permease [Humitalea rosea]
MRPFPRLFLANAGAHAADQLALAALPLTAVVALGAGAREVGWLIAAQSAAWLLCSLPAGVLVDHTRRRRLLVAAMLVAAAGAALALTGALGGSLVLLGLGAAAGSCGTVVFALSAGALVPVLVAPGAMPAANARLELARALVTLAAPLLAGGLVGAGLGAGVYGLAAVAALAAAATAWRLPEGGAPEPATRPALSLLLREGAGFVAAQPLLRAIFLCAVCWNFAFFAWLAGFVPYTVATLGLVAEQIGLAQAGYGAGLLLGAAAAPALLARLAPRVILLAGPGLSLLAPLLLVTVPGVAGGFLAQLMLGFGPMLWLVTQTSIRQLLTPAALQGRVAATMQVALYGVRPLGALAGGALAASFGPGAAIGLAGLVFLASFAVAAGSALARLRAMPLAAASP